MINPNSLYGKYIYGEIEVMELNQKDFNTLMIQWYVDYKAKNGTDSFEDFLVTMNYIL